MLAGKLLHVYCNHLHIYTRPGVSDGCNSWLPNTRVKGVAIGIGTNDYSNSTISNSQCTIISNKFISIQRRPLKFDETKIDDLLKNWHTSLSVWEEHQNLKVS